MKITITPYSAEDKADVLAMMALFNQIEGYPFNPAVWEKNLEEFTTNKSLGRIFLITYENSTVGYIVLAFGFSFEYKGRDAFIDEIFIKEGYRNRGIGKIAMDFIEAKARELGVNAIHLEVEAHNENAAMLYLNKGYTSNNRKLLTKRL
ncbi:GNAT family N-acetyltransferase [Fulvivirga ulvae]|uniref:GNAT family N-acetyltransferase n=1 Tax=Fulvivirga ulvae TaxID=2904245 RepID=UPI001F1E7E4B|nr:GNAT family N-acetyltransferase [Fulvivirga ulvae]UII29568.1 GNAT family N-acetyltransferase [Fulvivirga ulvae]